MKKRSLRYAGDKAVRALLERYACPTSFHVVRTRLLGNIATPKLDASPLRAIESFWEGELPGFDNVGAASELFESLMGLWNELARHQSATKPFRLTRMEAKPDTDDIRRLCRTRTEELEGFIDGLFGDAELIGNSNLQCRSHYWIIENQIRWCAPMEDWETKQAERREFARALEERGTDETRWKKRIGNLWTSVRKWWKE